MSVRAKIFLITFSLLALATGGGGLFIQYQLTGYLNDDVNSNLENHAKIAQKLFIDAGLNVTNADILADDLGEASDASPKSSAKISALVTFNPASIKSF